MFYLFHARSNGSLFVILALAVTLPLGTRCPAQERGVLTLDASIALPGVKGRIDHLSVDLKGERLFVAAVENHSVEVIDLKAGRRVHTIADLPEPQGVLYEPSSNRLFVASALDGSVRIFDASTFEEVATAKFPDDADNLRYDPHSQRVIVGFAGAKQLRNRGEGSGGLGFIDLNGKIAAEIVVDARPESFQVEQNGTRVFVNVPDKKEVQVFDTVRRASIYRWPLTVEDNFPLALDEVHHRALVGCWQPPLLLVFDTEDGKLMGSTAIAGKSDDLFYDAARGRVYVLTSAGFLEVLQQKDPDHYERTARFPTPSGTQTGLFVPEWSKLFAAVRRQGQENAEIRIYRAH